MQKRILLPLVLAFTYMSGQIWADRTIVTMETNFGDITISLLTDDAPKTVANFLNYVQTDFYDGLIFHRVINSPSPFVIQAGAYDPNLYLANNITDPNYFANPAWTKDPNFFHTPNAPVESEADNGFDNIRGTIAMALFANNPDSGTSQFFINLATNSHLDADFTVFGEILIGMEPNGVVDSIAALDTMSIDTLTDIPDANTPVIINDITIEQIFANDSADFTTTDYLQATDGDFRTYVGQGNFAGKRYTHTFTEEKFMGVQALHWHQSAIEEVDLPTFDLRLAKDSNDIIWALDYQIDSNALVEPNTLLDATTLAHLGQQDMLFKLIAGDFNPIDPNNPNDPNNTITIIDSNDTIIEKIFDDQESLDPFPDFDNELLLVRSVLEPNQAMTDWRFNHTSQGLALELIDNSQTQGTIDPNGDGWRFLIPDPITGLEVSLKAHKNRSLSRDSFYLTGDFDLDRETIINNPLYIFLGPFEHKIEIDQIRLSRNQMIYAHKGVTTNGGRVYMKIDFNRSIFTLRANRIDLTGLEDPAYFEMTSESLFSSGNATIRRNRPLPMGLRQGVTDSLRLTHFRHSQRGFSSRALTLRGEIATQVDPVNLEGRPVTLKWDSKTVTIPSSSLTRIGSGHKYVLNTQLSSLRRAIFDFNRNTFRIDFTGAGFNRPTSSGRDFTIDFDLTDDLNFNETVANITPSNLPKTSGE